MLCRKPFTSGLLAFGCGQCNPCRINRRRVWSWRMFLESLCHDHSAFVTLTYDEEHLPHGATLEPPALQSFLKRLRASHSRPLRFFAVGEYGEHTHRPHYHLALFGLSPVDGHLVDRSWPDGHVHIGDLTPSSANYIAGYVVKKMTHASDPRLAGRHPEFARMSLRPGIGAPAMQVLRDALNNQVGLSEIRSTGDVPRNLQLGRQSIPLARYLRKRLREELLLDDEDTSNSRIAYSLSLSDEVRALLEASLARGEVASLSQLIAQRDHQRILNAESRAKLKGQRSL